MSDLILEEQNIQDKIFTIRNQQVILDKDLAQLYGVDTRVLNQAVKRNIKRFPQKFMFQLTKEEYELLISQSVILSDNSLTSQSVTLNNKRGKHRKYLPYAFTEQGVSMLSAVLHSEAAIQVSIRIMNAFVNMRKFLLANAAIFQKFDYIEQKLFTYDKNFEKIFKAIESKEAKPKQGIFYNGQIFDAYVFVADLIKSAKKSILLIDNYIDETVLILLAKRKKNVLATIYTKKISKQLALDLDKYNQQYTPIEIKEFQDAHDRFLIIDKKQIYHFGASLKDLGKKWFAFSKFEIEAFDILTKLEK